MQEQRELRLKVPPQISPTVMREGEVFSVFFPFFFPSAVLSNLHCSPPTDRLISKADTAPLAARYSTVFTVRLCLRTSKHSPACSPRTLFTPVRLRLHVKQQKAVRELADGRRRNTGNLLKKPLLARWIAAVTQVANTTHSPSLLTNSHHPAPVLKQKAAFSLQSNDCDADGYDCWKKKTWR